MKQLKVSSHSVGQEKACPVSDTSLSRIIGRVLSIALCVTHCAICGGSLRRSTVKPVIYDCTCSSVRPVTPPGLFLYSVEIKVCVCVCGGCVVWWWYVCVCVCVCERESSLARSHSKTLFYKDCSLGSIKNLTTSPC